jgi:ABC-type multidrug transport system fused ATPase/permease subunit
LGALPQLLTNYFEALVSLNRLTAYLSSPEIRDPDESDVSEQIRLFHASIAWSPGAMVNGIDTRATPFQLTDLDFYVPLGKITLCIGPLGSGKTLLLLGLLGEAYVVGGKVCAPRSQPDAVPAREDVDERDTFSEEEWLDNSVAYAPQQAYIHHGSIRSNITFGQPFWPDRYWETLRQVSLLPDLELMQDGDLTELGENGVQCSGGQRARIGLARCVYSRASTLYLDDPLSAVDSHTAKWIVEECLQGPLLQNRTVVLVTHQVSLCLPVADYLVELKNGTVRQACSITSADDFSRLLLEVEGDEQGQDEGGGGREDPKSPEADTEAMPPPSTSQKQRDVRQVYQAEARAIGRVAATHYWMVLRAAGGPIYWTLFAIIFVATQGTSVAESVWLRTWTADDDESRVSYYLGGYGLIVFIGIILGGTRWIWLYGFGNGHSPFTVGFSSSGSRKIHARLLKCLSSAPLAFFEGTPSARVLNRFASDMNRVDANVSDGKHRCIHGVLQRN